MTFTFRDFLARLFSSFVDSMTRSCCAPSTTKCDLDLQDPQESKLRDIAKMTAFGTNYGETVIDDDDDNDIYSITKYTHLSHLNHRDILLISGYIHQLQQTLTFWNTNNSIKPIADLCINYYHTHSRSVCFMYLMAEHCDTSSYPSLDSSDEEEDDEYMDNSSSNYGGIYISEVNNSNQKHYVNIYDLQEPHKLSIFSNEWIIKFAGLTATKDIVLPSSIHKDIVNQYKRKQSQYKHIMREYNIIFRLCGSGKEGWSDSCNAVIIDETYINNTRTNNEVFGFNWRLPELPIKTGGNAVTFSGTHGLISVGGYKSNQCHVLSFNSDAYFEQNYDWYWNELPTMHEIRWFPSCCMMDDNKLIAMGGSSADHEPLSSMECYDFEGDEWRYLSSCNKARKYGGLCNIDGDRLYLGGGDHATQSVEWYDIHQDRWFNLPNTQIPHKYYPSLWKHKDSLNVLYISCSYSNSVECIDLRAHETSWNVVCAANLFETDSLDLDYNQFRSIL